MSLDDTWFGRRMARFRSKYGNPMPGVVPREVRLGIDRLQAHQPHQTLGRRAADAEVRAIFRLP